MDLPDKIFFTGVPGSRWSGIAQTIESLDGFNISDRTPEREFVHNGTSGHRGAYFGKGMEFEPYLNQIYIESAWKEKGKCKLVKSHCWTYKLNSIKEIFPNDWVMLVYRPDIASYNWWNTAGGFDIKYPNYAYYQNQENILKEISNQNLEILKFAYVNKLSWEYFTSEWIEKNFHQTKKDIKTWPDILVTLLK